MAKEIAKVEDPKALATLDMTGLLAEGDNHDDAINVTGRSAVPIIRLLQSGSPEVKAKTAPDGFYYHPIAQETLPEVFTMIALRVFDTYTIWEPKKLGGKRIATAFDGENWDKPNLEFNYYDKDGKPYKDESGKPRVFNTRSGVRASGLAEWGAADPTDRDSPPVAQRALNLFGIVKHDLALSPCRLIFGGTSAKIADKFIQVLQFKRRRHAINGKELPPFALQFDLTTQGASNASGDWHAPVFLNVRPLEAGDKELFLMAKDLFDSSREVFQRAMEEDTMETGDDAPADVTLGDNKF